MQLSGEPLLNVNADYSSASKPATRMKAELSADWASPKGSRAPAGTLDAVALELVEDQAGQLRHKHS